jgi:serine/threonine protein kinase
MGIQNLHSNGICHRDIKPDNILISNEGDMKIIDLFTSKYFKEKFTYDEDVKSNLKMLTVVGTLNYRAPETFIFSEYTEQIDLWSCGATLYYMLTGLMPFSSDNMAATINNINVGLSALDLTGLPLDAVDLLKCLLTVDPMERYSVKEALNHKWFY